MNGALGQGSEALHPKFLDHTQASPQTQQDIGGDVARNNREGSKLIAEHLGVSAHPNILEDCEADYGVYDRVIREVKGADEAHYLHCGGNRDGQRPMGMNA